MKHALLDHHSQTGRRLLRQFKLPRELHFADLSCVPGNYASIIAPNLGFRHQCEAVFWGQAFHVFQCYGNPSGAAV